MLISTRQIFYSKRSDRAMGRQTQHIHLYPDQSTRAYTCVYCASLKITHTHQYQAHISKFLTTPYSSAAVRLPAHRFSNFSNSCNGCRCTYSSGIATRKWNNNTCSMSCHVYTSTAVKYSDIVAISVPFDIIAISLD